MFSSITYCPPGDLQWITTDWSHLPPWFSSSLHSSNLPPLAIPNKPPPTDEAKMSVVLLLSLLLLRRRPPAWQWEVILHPPQALRSMKTRCEMKQLTVWSTKAFQQLDHGDQTEHFTVDLWRAKTSENTALPQTLCLFGRDGELPSTSRMKRNLTFRFWVWHIII